MYELMVIGNPKTDSEKFLAQVKKILEGASATNLKVEKMGKKLLAYPIAKQTEGEYLVFNFEAQPQAAFEITKTLGLEQEAVLRYLLVRAKVTESKEGSKKSVEPKEKKAKVTVKTTSNVVKTKSDLAKTKVITKKPSKVVKNNKVKGKKGKN